MNATAQLQLDSQLREALAHFPQIVLAVLFGSVAQDRQQADSDLDIAVTARSVKSKHDD